jgi:hypothetical protein
MSTVSLNASSERNGLLALVVVTIWTVQPVRAFDAHSTRIDDVPPLQSVSQSRNLQTIVSITDATTNFIPSSESIFDHMIIMNGADNLSFHWNDISNDIIRGRLIHKADTIEQAPSWLGFGVYHSNHDYTTLPTATDSFMKGSSAIIGMVSEQSLEYEAPAKQYVLSNQTTNAIQESLDASILSATVLQHDSDDGTVITELSFSKKLVGSPSSSTELRREGTNVFLWAVGQPGDNLGVLERHSFKGALFVDFQQVREKVVGTTTTTTSASGTTVGTISSPLTENSGAPANVGSTPPPTHTNMVPDRRPNISPTVSADCTSTILGEGSGIGKVALTPTSTFSFQILENQKVQIALEHVSFHPVWLGVASSPNGYMVGSSAIIGSPGNDTLAISPPQGFSLTDQLRSGIIKNPDLSLENASIESITTDDGRKRTILKFTKPLWDDSNESVPILHFEQGATATFLYAVGEGRELTYHQHRGQFRLDLSLCGGTFTSTGSANGQADSKVWTKRRLFAAHGFLAALAWAFFTPCAVTVAGFRILVPASWIYIHVFANVLAVLLTVVAVILAVVGVAKQDDGDHFSTTHHWIGTILMAMSTIQVTNGFLRPPVERKDPPQGNNGMLHTLPMQRVVFGVFYVPRTPREAWHKIHRTAGLAIVAMGIYQTQSGLKLYATRFQVSSIVKYYWMYVVIFLVSLIVLKLYVIREEDRARQGVLRAVSTTEPCHEDEPEEETFDINHTVI